MIKSIFICMPGRQTKDPVITRKETPREDVKTIYFEKMSQLTCSEYHFIQSLLL